MPGSCDEGIRDAGCPLITELFCHPSLGVNEHIIDW